MTATHTPPLISFIARKGGVGKSTCATLISRIYAENGLRVVVADCDPQGTTTESLLASARAEHVSTFGTRLCSGESIADLPEPTSHDERISIVPASEALTLHAAELDRDALGVIKVQQTLASLSEVEADVVVIDTPGNYGVLTFGALAASRWAVVTTFCQKPSAREVPKALDVVREARKANPNLELLGVIANNLDSRARHELRVLATMRKALSYRLVEPPVPRATAITAAMDPGGALDRRNKGIRSMAQVSEELLRRHLAGVRQPSTPSDGPPAGLCAARVAVTEVVAVDTVGEVETKEQAA